MVVRQADKGYRGPRASWPSVEIVRPGQRSTDEAPRQRRRKQLRRCGVIESLIGNMKKNGLLDRNWLKGKPGDAIHAVPCAAGQNLRLTPKAIAAFFACYPVGQHRHLAPEERTQASQGWFALAWDIATFPPLAGSRHVSVTGPTGLAT